MIFIVVVYQAHVRIPVERICYKYSMKQWLSRSPEIKTLTIYLKYVVRSAKSNNNIIYEKNNNDLKKLTKENNINTGI